MPPDGFFEGLGAVVAAIILSAGAYLLGGWQRARNQQTEAEDEAAEVEVARIGAQTATDAALWAHIHNLEDRLDQAQLRQEQAREACEARIADLTKALREIERQNYQLQARIARYESEHGGDG